MDIIVITAGTFTAPSTDTSLWDIRLCKLWSLGFVYFGGFSSPVPEESWQLRARSWRPSPCHQWWHSRLPRGDAQLEERLERRDGPVAGLGHLMPSLSPCRERHQRSQTEAEEDLRRELGIFLFLIFLFLLFQYGVYIINKSDLTCGKAFQILGGLLPTYLSASGCCSLLSLNRHHVPPPDKHYKV